MIVLSAQTEVAGYDASFRTHDSHDDKCEEDNSKHVVHLPSPVKRGGMKVTVFMNNYTVLTVNC